VELAVAFLAGVEHDFGATVRRVFTYKMKAENLAHRMGWEIRVGASEAK